MSKILFSEEHTRLCSILRRERNNAKLSQRSLAKRLEKPQSFVAKYERGGSRIDVLEFVEITKAIGYDYRLVIDEILSWSPPEDEKITTFEGKQVTDLLENVQHIVRHFKITMRDFHMAASKIDAYLSKQIPFFQNNINSFEVSSQYAIHDIATFVSKAFLEVSVTIEAERLLAPIDIINAQRTLDENPYVEKLGKKHIEYRDRLRRNFLTFIEYKKITTKKWQENMMDLDHELSTLILTYIFPMDGEPHKGDFLENKSIDEKFDFITKSSQVCDIIFQAYGIKLPHYSHLTEIEISEDMIDDFDKGKPLINIPRRIT